MAYDRYDTRRERESSRHPDHRERGGRHDERGFFERAGDEISSWFGDSDDHREGRHHRDDDRMNRSGWSGGNDRDRGEWRGSSRPMSSGSPDTDYRSGSGRGQDRERDYRPMAGDYGRFEQDRSARSQSAWDRDDNRRTSFAGSGRSNDPHYKSWRERHLSELDRDYDDYHRERQQHFENDFGTWRETRQQKRQMLGSAREHMDVVGSDGEPVGKVDCVSGDRIVLTKSDAEDGRHHTIPCSMIDKIEGDQVTLDCTAADAKAKWRSEGNERALFEREGRRDEGPHMLDRSFSGTYR